MDNEIRKAYNGNDEITLTEVELPLNREKNYTRFFVEYLKDGRVPVATEVCKTEDQAHLVFAEWLEYEEDETQWEII